LGQDLAFCDRWAAPVPASLPEAAGEGRQV
jgi:hypothetical protein